MISTVFVVRKAAPLLAIAALAFVAFPTAVQAAISYPVQTIGESEHTLTEASIGIDDSGDRVAVWKERLPSGGYAVDAATRPSEGSWSEPVAISEAKEEIQTVSVAVNSRGEAAASWMREYSSPNWVVETAHMTSSGTWSAPTAMAPATGVNSHEPRIGIDAEGDATVAWREYLGPYWGAVVASQEGGAWGPSLLLSDPSENFEAPELAVSPNGAAVVTWGSSSVIEGTTRPAGGNWAVGAVIASSGSSGLQRAVPGIDPAGEATVAWALNDGTHYIVQAATKSAGGSWATRTVGEAAGNNRAPTLSVNAEGDALLAWIHDFHTVETSERASGGSWSAPSSIPAVGGGVEIWSIDSALDEAGDSILAYDGEAPGERYSAWASRRDAGGSWTEAVEISEGEEAAYEVPSVALNPTGSLAIAWASEISSGYLVKAIGIDNTATLSVTKDGTGSGTVTGDKGGIDCGPLCSAQITAGNEVTLTATPAAGSAFAGWSGDCSGTGSCTVDMGAARSVGADFTAVTPPPVTPLPTPPPTTSKPVTPPPVTPPPTTSKTVMPGLHLVQVKRNKTHGTAVVRFRVPASGRLTVYGKGVKATKVTVKKAGYSSVKLVPKGAYRTRLSRHHRGFTVVKARFRPAAGGTATTWSRRIRLVWRQG